MEAIVFVILQIFFATRTVLIIEKYDSDISRLGHIQLHDAEQSHASGNIWWIAYFFRINLLSVLAWMPLADSITDYIITRIIRAFWLVLTYDLLEDRRTIDVIIKKFFPPCFKIAEIFENLDNIFRDWAKDKVQKSLAEALNRIEKQEEEI